MCYKQKCKVVSLNLAHPVYMKKFIRHAGSNTNITMTMSMQRQICTYIFF